MAPLFQINRPTWSWGFVQGFRLSGSVSVEGPGYNTGCMLGQSPLEGLNMELRGPEYTYNSPCGTHYWVGIDPKPYSPKP